MNESDYVLKNTDKELIDMVRNLIKNKELDELRQISEHKCFNCVWSKWTGTKFTCFWTTRCVKSLRQIKSKKD